jgi:hypothetical protein
MILGVGEAAGAKARHLKQSVCGTTEQVAVIGTTEQAAEKLALARKTIAQRLKPFSIQMP